jgi:uncharacterized Zn finger protein
VSGIHHSVADLVEEPAMRPLAGQDAHRRGLAMADAGRARLVRSAPLEVAVEVEDDRGHLVELRSTPDGLTWSCDCAPASSGTFCAHCVAAGTVCWRSAPKRRRPPG